MRMLDDVIVINDKYESEGVKKGMRGTILDADIRWNSFCVNFQDQRVYDREFMSVEDNIFKLEDDIYTAIKIEDLELFKEGGMTDEGLYRNLPENHKDWWCKVENGFIMNLEGKKKNKIPYDYDS